MEIVMLKHFKTLNHTINLPYKFSTGPVLHRFFEGLKEGKILANTCPECKKILVPARTFCPECYVDMDKWVEVSGEGEVVTWTLAKESFYGMPMDCPFIGALIQLDGTDCDFLHIIGGIDLGDMNGIKKKVKIGSRVKAVWNEEREGSLLDIKYFEPI
jgi:uncharacterized OB-fold protein